MMYNSFRSLGSIAEYLKHPDRIGALPRIAGMAALLAAPLFSTAALAQADPPVIVKLTILQITDLNDDDDGLSDADFYVKGKFSDTLSSLEFNNVSFRMEGEEEIHPNWTYEFPASSAIGNATIELQVMDFDSGFAGGDDETVNATLDVSFRPCHITGSGVDIGCGWDATISQSDLVKVRVEVFLPPSSPGLNIRCLQRPLNPQFGDSVTITAETLDGAAAATKIVDSITIEVNNTQAAQTTGVSQATYTFVPVEPRFRMRCFANNLAGATPEVADTWTRDVRVGETGEVAAPIGIMGSSARNIDVVAMPDSSSYPGGWKSALFQNELYDAIWDGYYSDPFVLGVQDKISLWIAKTEGGVSGTATDCDPIIAPENWDQYSFADTGWILHNDAHRDCAEIAMRLFSSLNSNPVVAVHETGHSPFGLADEYCCDGGYFQSEELPNVFSSLAACIAEAPLVGAVASDCRVITGSWYTLDPASNDIMVDNATFNTLDIRRWRWLLNQCVNSGWGC